MGGPDKDRVIFPFQGNCSEKTFTVTTLKTIKYTNLEPPITMILVNDYPQKMHEPISDPIRNPASISAQMHK